MNPITATTYTEKPKKHIRFDLSKNQTYIIDGPNPNEEIVDGNNYIFFTIVFFAIISILAIVAYSNHHHNCAYVLGGVVLCSSAVVVVSCVKLFIF